MCLNITSERNDYDWLQKLWSQYKAYAPSDFKESIEKANNKNQLAWEMLLGTVLLENKFTLANPDYLKNLSIKKNGRPDICLVHNNKRIWIECYMPGRGEENNQNSVPPWTYMGEIHQDGSYEEYEQRNHQVVDLDKSLLRITNGLKGKKEQYDKWSKEEICKNDEPFIIAINGKDLDLSIYRDDYPDILRAVYPLGEKSIVVHLDSGKVESYRPHQPNITKYPKVLINTDYFLQEDNKFISGILFSTDWLGRGSSDNPPKYCFMKNIKASNPCPISFESFAQEFDYPDNNSIRLKDDINHESLDETFASTKL